MRRFIFWTVPLAVFALGVAAVVYAVTGPYEAQFKELVGGAEELYEQVDVSGSETADFLDTARNHLDDAG